MGEAIEQIKAVGRNRPQRYRQERVFGKHNKAAVGILYITE
ncbi:MAG TPA: hypothetical protein VIX91_16525 [Candidatus Acidoferrum sp.]